MKLHKILRTSEESLSNNVCQLINTEIIKMLWRNDDYHQKPSEFLEKQCSDALNISDLRSLI